MAIDQRTRWDDEPERVDPLAWFTTALPALIVDEPELVASTAALDLRPVVVEVDRHPVTLRRADTGRPEVVAGAAADAQERWSLTDDQAARILTDQVTPVGLMTAGELTLDRGRIARIMDWWLVVRVLRDRRPCFTRGSVTVDADLDRGFTLADEPTDAARFLRTNGFVHLRGVFDAGEMAAIAADMDAYEDRYTDGDGRSWWATLADGTRRVVRMQYFDEHSAATAALLRDDRLAALAALGGGEHRFTREGRDGNRIEALFKPLGVAEGISDIPWHKDCSLGRHSYNCCGLTVGISVTPGGPTTGQLHAIAGSHRALVWPSLLDPTTLGLPDVALPTGTGDVTVHLSCTLHRAEPPTDGERKVLYTGFALPARDPAAAGAAHRALMQTSRERAPLTTSQSSVPY